MMFRRGLAALLSRLKALLRKLAGRSAVAAAPVVLDFLPAELRQKSYIRDNCEKLLDLALEHDGSMYFFDNIHGDFDRVAPEGEIGREATLGQTYGSYHRQRALVHALMQALNRHPVLAFNQPDFSIRGCGLSDAWDVAEQLSRRFSYTNTFFHKEPKLDVKIGSPKFMDLDFITSSDVFEHVAPPIDEAFRNAYRMLKPGGVLVLTVPYLTTREETIEHFPELHEWSVVKHGDGFRLNNITRHGEHQVFDNLVFHGGEGATLEMRVFALAHLRRLAAEAGFRDFHILDRDIPFFGIYNQQKLWSLPLILRK